jgi:hypothetical protein
MPENDWPLIRVEFGRPNKHRESHVTVEVLTETIDGTGASYRRHDVGLVKLYPPKTKMTPARKIREGRRKP